MKTKTLVLVIVAIGVIGSVWYLEKDKVAPGGKEIVNSDIPLATTTIKSETTETPTETKTPIKPKGGITEKVKTFERAKEISTPDGFINVPSIKIADLIGKKIILVDFWTYSCINCQRTTPYLNAWYEKYKNTGLEIIGLHTPEFEFEKEYTNVLVATQKFNIKYPVVLDNDYSTWQSYKNRYWPRKYLIDIDGFIVYDHIGEGDYEATERKIQELLTERKKNLGTNDVIPAGIANPKNAESIEGKAVSLETYFGASRNNFLGNGTPQKTGEQTMTEPQKPLPGVLYLAGTWNFTDEYAENKTAGKIIFRYKAEKVFFVGNSETGINLKILKDGILVKTITVKNSELYRLIDDVYGEHTLEIQIDSPGLKAFTFTFG